MIDLTIAIMKTNSSYIEGYTENTNTRSDTVVMDTIYKAAMRNNLTEMKHMITDLNRFLRSHRIPGKLLYEVNLVIEEPLSNIIKYGNKMDVPISIHVEVTIGKEDISILLTDDGRPFNPIAVPHLDIRKPAIERPPGGLGMHLVRNIMNSMWYERKEGKNIFHIQIER